MEAWQRAGTDVFSPSEYDHIDLVKEDQYVYIADVTRISQFVSEDPEILRMIRINNFNLKYGFGLPLNSIYKGEISRM